MSIHRAPRIFQVGQSAGGQTIGAGPTAVQFDSTPVPLTGITLSGSNLLTFASPALGTYKVSYHLSGTLDAGNQQSWQTYITLNGTEVGFTRGAIYVRSAGNYDDASGETFITVAAGNTIQLVAVRAVGANNLVIAANGASFVFERVQ